MDEDFGHEIAASVERMYRRSNPVYAAEKAREEQRRWAEENRERLQRERYEELSPARRREQARLRETATRAQGLWRVLAGTLYAPGAFSLGSPTLESKVRAALKELRAELDVPEAQLSAIIDGWLARVESGDGRGARAFLEAEVERLAADGHGPREDREEPDPRALAAEIRR